MAGESITKKSGGMGYAIAAGVLLVYGAYATMEWMKNSKAIKDSGFKIDKTTGKLVAAV